MATQVGKVGRRKRRAPTVTFNASLCSYPVILDAARARGWKVVDEEEDESEGGALGANLYWIDTTAIKDTLCRIEPWQRVNHFPGMSNLARKSRLAKNLARMWKLAPREYGFFPRTWVLPADANDFRKQFDAEGKSAKPFIVKPDAGCQGRGIYLTRSLDEVMGGGKADECQVVQRYIRRPLLVDGFKFDLRVYCLVSSCAPLRMYLFADGLTRLCTTAYVKPTAENISERCMHLTNYAVNKRSDNFVFNEDADDDGAGSKRSLRWFRDWLGENHGVAARDTCWAAMSDVIIKMLISVQPQLSKEYVASMPRDATPEGSTPSRCFEVLGVDIMIDSALKPWLIEVNHLPSFKCDTPLDQDIKERLITQTLELLKLTGDEKRLYQARVREQSKARLHGGGAVAALEGAAAREAAAASSGGGGGGGGGGPKAAAAAVARAGNNTTTPRSARAAGGSAGAAGGPEEGSPAALSATASPPPVAPGREEEEDEGGASGSSGEQAAAAGATGGGGSSNNDEGLLDYSLIYPPPPGSALEAKYNALLEQSTNSQNAWQTRLVAPLQQKRGEDIDLAGGTAALLHSKMKREDYGRDCFGHFNSDRRGLAHPERKKAGAAVPSKEQVDRAVRLMAGHSSTSTREVVARSAPSVFRPNGLRRAPDDAKDGVGYGMRYRQLKEEKRKQPTLALKTVSIGGFGGGGGGGGAFGDFFGGAGAGAGGADGGAVDAGGAAGYGGGASVRRGGQFGAGGASQVPASSLSGYGGLSIGF